MAILRGTCGGPVSREKERVLSWYIIVSPRAAADLFTQIEDDIRGMCLDIILSYIP